VLNFNHEVAYIEILVVFQFIEIIYNKL